MPRTGLAVGNTRSTQDQFADLLRASFPGMHTVAADSLRTARSVMAAARPEFIVLEPELRDGSGAELMHLSRQTMPGSRVVVMGTLSNLAGMLATLHSGALGYLLVEEPQEVLIRQMRSIERGELSCAPVVAELVIGLLAQPAPDSMPEQQRTILALAAKGLTNEQIASRLGLSVSAVETHRKRLYAKLSVTSRVRAVHRARRLGM